MPLKTCRRSGTGFPSAGPTGTVKVNSAVDGAKHMFALQAW
jgi:hypothetical protein